jgi:class 3 adenylate cyclase/tetratricopeptide (TPR) repeat protein
VTQDPSSPQVGLPPRAENADDAEIKGNRGYVAVFFTDLCDYTSLNETLDPEDAEQLRRQVEALATRVIHKHGGSVCQVYGDGVLAVFGIPRPAEDDARRAIEAAIELHEAMRTAEWHASGAVPFEARLHTGIHAGLVLARHGDEVHGRYQVVGDVVNTASRLCGAAGRDEIFVSETALLGFEGFFDAAPAVELSLKGKRSVVAVHQVTGRSDVRTRFEARSRRGLTTFVGRQSELEQLVRLLSESVNARGRLVLVSGPPGIGKSRLLEEFGARASDSGVRVLRGACTGYGETPPLEPFLQVLRNLFGIRPTTRAAEAERIITAELRPLGDAAAHHTATLLQLLSLRASSSEITVTAAEHRVVGALTDLITALSDRSPLLLMLDDWHWSDEISGRVLESIALSSEARAICTVVGMREPGHRPPALSRAHPLPLAPLKEEESNAFIQALRPNSRDSGMARVIQVRSGGNPLFLEELCRSLPDDDYGDGRALERAAIPSTLQGVIQARFAQLPIAQTRVLRAASVIGTEFTNTRLLEILQDADNPELLDALDALYRAGLVYPTPQEGIFSFKHGITRDVVYESVLIGERRSIHRAVARAIEGSVAEAGAADQSEALAYHYRGAGDHDLAARYAELAGNKALTASALDRARSQYAAALAALDKLPASEEIKRRWVVISTKWAGTCTYSPERSQLESLSRAAAYAKELRDTVAEAQVEYGLGWICYTLGDHLEPLKHYRRALELAEAAGNAKFAVQLWANLGQSHAAAGEHHEALAFLTRSIEGKRSRAGHGRLASKDVDARLVAGAASAYAFGCRASVHANIGDFDQADDDLGEALTIARDTGHPVEGSVRALQSMVEIYRGQWEASIEAAARSRAIAERLDSAYVLATSRAFEAYSRCMLERTRESLDELRRAVAWLEVHDTKLFISFSYGCFADALVGAGELDSACDFATRALSRARCHDPLGETMAYRALSQVHLASGDGAMAEECLRRATALANKSGSRRDMAVTRLLGVECRLPRAVGGGALEDARQVAESALGDFERMGMRWYAERARRILAQL